MAIAPIPLPRSARPGGYPNPHVGGGPLGNLLGWNGNPLYDAFDKRRNTLMGIGAGLLSGNWGNMGQYAMQGRQMDDAYATQQKAEAQRQDSMNKTVQAMLEAGREDLANMAESGFMEEAWRGYLDHVKAQNEGTEGKYGLTPIWGVGPDGQPALGQLNTAGGISPVETPEGFQFGKDPIRMDAGTHWVLLDPVTRQQIGTIPKQGDMPTGYQHAQEGGIEPMPGSEPDIERTGQRVKAETALSTLEAKTDVALQAVDKALSDANWLTSGAVGGATSGVWGTPAFDLARTLDTIKANIGFDELNTMRQNSPTGGALGNVTERELAFLQSTIANIEQAQSEQQLKENLQILREFLAGSRDRRRAAFQQQFGGQSAPSQNTTSTGIPWSVEP